MEPKINISGTAATLKIHKTPGYERHYVVVSATAKAEGMDNYDTPDIHLEVPISEEQYYSLRKKLDESKAEEPILRVNGKLELTLDSVCIN